MSESAQAVQESKASEPKAESVKSEKSQGRKPAAKQAEPKTDWVVQTHGQPTDAQRERYNVVE